MLRSWIVRAVRIAKQLLMLYSGIVQDLHVTRTPPAAAAAAAAATVVAAAAAVAHSRIALLTLL